MLNKLTSATLVAALFIGLCGTSAFASNSPDKGEINDAVNATADTPAKPEPQPDPQLKNKMLKLVADAKAGKVAPPARSDIQPARSSSWSKGTKIAVGVGIAVAVIAVVVIVQAKKGVVLR